MRGEFEFEVRTGALRSLTDSECDVCCAARSADEVRAVGVVSSALARTRRELGLGLGLELGLGLGRVQDASASRASGRRSWPLNRLLSGKRHAAPSRTAHGAQFTARRVRSASPRSSSDVLLTCLLSSSAQLLLSMDYDVHDIVRRSSSPLHRSARTYVVCALPLDRKSTRLNSSHSGESRMPSSA